MVLNQAVLAYSKAWCLQGSEARDALLAQIFGCAALVRTGKVQELAAADAMTTVLLSAGGKKAFLREVAAEVLLEMMGADCTKVNLSLTTPPCLLQLAVATTTVGTLCGCSSGRRSFQCTDVLDAAHIGDDSV